MRKSMFIQMFFAACFIFATSAMAQNISATKENSASPENLIKNGSFEEGKDPGQYSTEGVGAKKHCALEHNNEDSGLYRQLLSLPQRQTMY